MTHPDIGKDTIFAASMGTNFWHEVRIAVNNNGTIEIWKPNRERDLEADWTKQSNEFSAHDASSPIGIAPDSGKWIAYSNGKNQLKLDRFEGLPSGHSFPFPNPQSISLTHSAKTIVVGKPEQVSVFHHDVEREWVEHDVTFKHLPGAEKVFVKFADQETGAFAMTQFAPGIAQTDVFRYTRNKWEPVCSRIFQKYSSATLPKIGQSVLSLNDLHLVVSYPGKTILYQSPGMHNCTWNEAITIRDSQSNFMKGDDKGDDNLLLIGYEHKNTKIFQIKWGNPDKKTTKKEMTDIQPTHSWILGFLSDNSVVVNGRDGGIYNIGISSTDGRTSNADLIVIAALFMIAALMKALRR